jgi:hypothetical protein
MEGVGGRAQLGAMRERRDQQYTRPYVLKIPPPSYSTKMRIKALTHGPFGGHSKSKLKQRVSAFLGDGSKWVSFEVMLFIQC